MQGGVEIIYNDWFYHSFFILAQLSQFLSLKEKPLVQSTH